MNFFCVCIKINKKNDKISTKIQLKAELPLTRTKIIVRLLKLALTNAKNYLFANLTKKVQKIGLFKYEKA